jgi:curved DNA-binding protein CbpA
MINYFDVLNVSENAEPEVIKASYKTLAKKYHPDSYMGSREDAEKKMALINEAYQILSDEHSKKRYLQQLRANRGADYREEKEHKSYNDAFNKASHSYEQFTHATDELKEYYDEKYAQSVDRVARFIRIVIVLIAAISIICCIFYFGPDMLKTFWENASNEIEQILYTFKR